jgi:putative oxidoreductase
MKRSDLPDLISFFLILMFSYATASKLIDFRSFRMQMLVQPVPNWSVVYLITLIPLTEIIAIVFLLFKKTKTAGFYTSAFLMLLFSVYVGLAMTGAFGSIPCSCGGVIGKLNWQQHFAFNLIFLSLSIYGIVIDYKERRFAGK